MFGTTEIVALLNHLAGPENILATEQRQPRTISETARIIRSLPVTVARVIGALWIRGGR
jgi:hypothetical protein